MLGRCPGRAFAEAELAVIVALLLSTCEMRLAREACGRRPTATRCSRGADAAAEEPASEMRRHGAGPRPSPGDPDGLLPAPELRRQVGVRWPTGACYVHVVQRRTLGQGSGY